MHKTVFLFLSLFISLLTPALAQQNEETLKALKADVLYLASDELKGRETGTEGEVMAAEYIAKRFAEVGLEPKGENNNFYQLFTRKPQANPHGDPHGHATEEKEITGRNVIGYLDNGAENTVVIGAHYDHLGMGSEGSLHAGEKAVHNGADDNASGVAAIIQIAKMLKGRAERNNYLFIAFSGEEKGLWGSNYFTKKPTVPLEKINYMINLDMVGRLDSNKLAINGTGTSPLWEEVFSAAVPDSIKVSESKSGIGPSDHTSFYKEDIPVLHFFTGQHEDYHKPSDDVEKVNFEGIMIVMDIIEKIIVELDDDGEIEFTKTKDADNKNTPKFSVTLGVMPDYLFDGKGMRIDAVREDRPAEKAGMKDGDIVIQMGKYEVHDMHSYMFALSKFKEGDKVKVTVKRGKKEKKFKVKF